MATSLARCSSSAGRGIAKLPYPERFQAAAAFAGFEQNPAALSLSQETSLMLYALYMQATKGQCSVPQPKMWNAVEYAKWSGWKQLGAVNSMEAMRLFVRTLEEEDPDWLSKMQGRDIEAPGEMPVQDSDLKPSSQEKDIPVSNDSPPSPPPLSSNGGISLDGKIQEDATECDIVKEIAVHNQWVSPTVSGRRPTSRYQHAAAVVDHKMFVIGGNHNGRYLNDVQVLDLRTLSWSKVEQSSAAPILSPCAGHSLIRRNNQLLVVGGHSKSFPETVTVHALDTETLKWVLLPTYGQAPVARRGQSVSLVGSGLVMFGGEDNKRRLLNDLNIFDLETMTWETINAVGPPPSPRADHAAGVYGGRYIYMFGGGSHSSCFNDLHVLDLESMEWSRKDTSVVLTPRAGHASAVVGDYWYIVGGGDNKAGVSETVVLNMDTLEWSSVTSVPARTYIACEGLSLVSAVLNGEETLIAFGGYNGRYSNETHVLKTGMMQKTALPVPSFGNHIAEVQDDCSGKGAVSRELADDRTVENGGYNTPKLLETKRELEASLAATHHENIKLKQDLTTKTAELSKELQSVRGQFVAEQSRCFKLEVEVAELRQKLQSMEELQKELDLLRKQKNASEEAMAAAMSQRQGSGVWGWLAGTPSDSVRTQ